MSLHRENIIWQSKDRTWNIGFWAFFETNPGDDPWDHEWDVEYRNDEFWFASTGHLTEEAAARSFNGPNPGGHTIQAYSTREAKYIRELDELAWAFKNPAAAKAKKDAAWAREVAKLQRAVRERLGDKPANEFYGQWQAKIQSQAGYGHMTVTDVPRVKAGWLYIGDYKIYNPSTKRFGKNVVDFTQQPASRNGFGYRGW